MKSDNKKKLRRAYYHFKGLVDNWKQVPFLLKKKNYSFSPVFIIGCGRSGTTILGNSLDKHKSIRYLNERRDIWHRAYPELDIWSGNHKNPLFFATADNNNIKKTKKLRQLYFREQVAANCTILMEKLPINNFRLKFIQACFPEARYIYLYRNGLEVAESISKKISNGWFGHKNLKWKLLTTFGKENGFNYSDEDLASDFHKGIYEWRLSMELSDNFFKTLDKEKYISISYSDLADNPYKTFNSIFNFLHLKATESLLKEITFSINRKNKKILQSEDATVLKIGGNLLLQSLDNNYFVY